MAYTQPNTAHKLIGEKKWQRRRPSSLENSHVEHFHRVEARMIKEICMKGV